MNAEEASLLWHRKADIEQAGGDAAHRKIALKNLKLKTVIKVRRGYHKHAYVALFKLPGDDAGRTSTSSL